MLPDITIELERPIAEYAHARIVALIIERFMRMWNTDEESLRVRVTVENDYSTTISCVHMTSRAEHSALVVPGTRVLEFYPSRRPQAQFTHASCYANLTSGYNAPVMRENSFVRHVTYL